MIRRAHEIRLHRPRRRAQRPRVCGVHGARGPQSAGARTPPRAGRGGGHRGSLPGLQVLGVLVRRVAAAARDHPGAGPAAARPRNPAAGRHVHADAQRRLSLARERPRAHVSRDRPALARRRRGLRRVRPRDGRDGALRQADPRHDAARPVVAQPAGAGTPGLSGPAFPRPARPRSLQPGAAHDDERDGFSRPVVRDRRAQGHDVGQRDHRHFPGRAFAGHGLRPAAPLHGRDRRCVPVVGTGPRRHRRDLRGDCRGGERGRCRNPDPDVGRQGPGARWRHARRRPGERR